MPCRCRHQTETGYWIEFDCPCPEIFPATPHEIDPLQSLEETLRRLREELRSGRVTGSGLGARREKLEPIKHDLQEEIDRQRDEAFKNVGDKTPYDPFSDMNFNWDQWMEEHLQDELEEYLRNQANKPIKHPERDPRNPDKGGNQNPATDCKCVHWSPGRGHRIELYDSSGRYIGRFEQNIWDKEKKGWVPNPELAKHGVVFNDNPGPGEDCCVTAAGQQEKFRRLGSILSGANIVFSIFTPDILTTFLNDNKFGIQVDPESPCKDEIKKSLDKLYDKINDPNSPERKNLESLRSLCGGKFSQLADCLLNTDGWKDKVKQITSSKSKLSRPLPPNAGSGWDDAQGMMWVDCDTIKNPKYEDNFDTFLFHEYTHACVDKFNTWGSELDTKFLELFVLGDPHNFFNPAPGDTAAEDLLRDFFNTAKEEEKKIKPGDPYETRIHGNYLYFNTQDGFVYVRGTDPPCRLL